MEVLRNQNGKGGVRKMEALSIREMDFDGSRSKRPVHKVIVTCAGIERERMWMEYTCH